MKTLRIFSLLLITTSLLFIGCEEGSDPVTTGPIITVNGDDNVIANPGEFAEFDISFSGRENDISQLEIDLNGARAELDVDFKTVGDKIVANPQVFVTPIASDSYILQLKAPDGIGENVYTVTVTDELGNTDAITLTISVENTTPPTISLIGNSEISLDAGSYTNIKINADAANANLVSVGLWLNGELYMNEVAMDNVDGNPSTLAENTTQLRDYNVGFRVPATAGGTYPFEIIVTDAAGLSATASYTVNTNTVTNDNLNEAELSWVRCGSTAGEGLDKFGLSWDANSNDLKAIFSNQGDKLVVLGADDYNLTTKTEVKNLIDGATGVDEYRGISVERSADYNVVLGTKVSDEYYLINITRADVSSQSCGTEVIVTGDYKN